MTVHLHCLNKGYAGYSHGGELLVLVISICEHEVSPHGLLSKDNKKKIIIHVVELFGVVKKNAGLRALPVQPG